MRAVVAWTDQVPEHDGTKGICYALAFRPDGTQLIAAVGSRVLMYDAADGDLLHSLKGHKDTVYCVVYCRDGKRFASGGADKTIIIWTHKAEGILKYSHGDSIQCLSYNPVTQQLASGTANDFGIWSPEQKAVSKHRATSRVLCCAWTGDGQHLALGMYGGQLSICDKNGVEQVAVVRPAPVWTLQWNNMQNKSSGFLAVGCWDGTLSFYDVSGKQIGKDKELGFDPCSVAYHDGKYVFVGGSDKRVMLYSKMGIKLTTVCETTDWIWAVCSRPKHDYVAVGCNDGSISMLQLIFSTVHGLYQEHYAFRDAMTDVVVQHLTSDEKVRIKCWDYIKKIAIYQESVAVQLRNKILVYEPDKDKSSNSHYRVSTRIDQTLDCNLLVLTSKHITLCQETKLQLYTLDGTKEREWLLESTIKYIKVCGGPGGGEGLLVGMKNGLVVRIWINSNFPGRLYKHSSGIRCLDLSSRRNHLAVVDETATIVVYDLQAKLVTFEDKYASSVAWNTQMESMLCYSGNGKLSIKTGDFPVHRQKLQGYVVGFQGSKIFCLHHLAMQTIEVPQSISMRNYVETKQFKNAYQVACLGVTEADWRLLGIEALQGDDWDVARDCFIRIKGVCYLDLIHRLQQGHPTVSPKPCVTALVLAYQGKFDEAAQAYVEAGQVEKAMEMFSDLRLFDKAKALAEDNELVLDVIGKTSVQEIIERQAEWTAETQDHETAADMYIAAGQLDKALALLAEHGPASKLIEVARRLKKTDTKELNLCITLMRQGGQHAHALETYAKLGDFRSILSLHVELEHWDDAFAMEKLYPEFQGMVSLPYAEWLVRNDRFDEARISYKQAGRADLSEQLLKKLIENGVKENRFSAAGYTCWLLAIEYAQQLDERERLELEEHKILDKYLHYRQLAEIYYAYSFIYQFTSEPFRTTSSETLFNVSRFLVAQLPKLPPQGVSMVNILVTLARHAEELGCYKVAMHAYEQLQRFRIPSGWVERVEIATMVARGRADCQNETQLLLYMPFCYCCSAPFPLRSSSCENICSMCLQPVFRSFLTFQQLPLVEFVLEAGSTHEEAVKIISAKQPRNSVDPNGRPTFVHDEGTKKRVLSDLLEISTFLGQGLMRISKATLTTLPKGQVMIQTCSKGLLPPRYFLAVDPDFAIFQCTSCSHFFEQEEWDLFNLREGTCPFCKESDAVPKF
ncbi:unnamed protein product [Calypogeia fissa]